MTLIVVGGIPGAGKSTAMRAHLGRPGVRVLDPDQIRKRVAARWLVHLVHQTLVWGWVLAGPGRTPVLLVQVAREQALAGQRQRGRVSPSRAFARHWERWQAMLDDLDSMSVPPIFVDREQVGPLVGDLVAQGLGPVPEAVAVERVQVLSAR